MSMTVRRRFIRDTATKVIDALAKSVITWKTNVTRATLEDQVIPIIKHVIPTVTFKATPKPGGITGLEAHIAHLKGRIKDLEDQLRVSQVQFNTPVARAVDNITGGTTGVLMSQKCYDDLKARVKELKESLDARDRHLETLRYILKLEDTGYLTPAVRLLKDSLDAREHLVTMLYNTLEIGPEDSLVAAVSDLKADNEHLTAAIATPEVYTGVISRAIEDRLQACQARVVSLHKDLDHAQTVCTNCGTAGRVRLCGKCADHSDRIRALVSALVRAENYLATGRPLVCACKGDYVCSIHLALRALNAGLSNREKPLQ